MCPSLSANATMVVGRFPGFKRGFIDQWSGRGNNRNRFYQKRLRIVPRSEYERNVCILVGSESGEFVGDHTLSSQEFDIFDCLSKLIGAYFPPLGEYLPDPSGHGTWGMCDR